MINKNIIIIQIGTGLWNKADTNEKCLDQRGINCLNQMPYC